MKKTDLRPSETELNQRLEELAELHGSAILLQSNGLYAFIQDPVLSIRKMKQALEALTSSTYEYIECVLTNCWIEGDEALKEGKYIMGLEEQIEKVTIIPECEIKQDGNAFLLSFDDYQLRCRALSRQDIIEAENGNKQRKPFKTGELLLEKSCLDKEALKEIKKNDEAYIAFISGTESLKDKKVVTVKKFRRAKKSSTTGK